MVALSLCAGIAGSAAADEYVVTLEMADFVYEGQRNLDIDLVIKPGDSIRWVWVSGQHNVVSGNHGDPDEGEEFDSGEPVGPPHEFVHIFENPGTFRYHCDLHFMFGMISEVTVEEACAADFNGDGTVNTQDVLAFLNAWNARDPRSDFNGDGNINTQDVLAFLNAWTAGC
jgi:plastocyanin